MKRFLVSIVALSALLVACNPEPNGEEPTQTPPAVEVDPNLNVAVVRATDSTITIGWTITESNVPYIGQIEPNPEATIRRILQSSIEFRSITTLRVQM